MQQGITFGQARLAAWLFFFAPGLGYGLITSRLPFLKAQAAISEGTLGLVLLSLGAAAVTGLLLANAILARVPVKAVLIGGTAVFLAFLCSAALAVNPWMLAAAFFGTGFFMSLVDVSMNVLGIEIERRFDKPALGILHAGYSCGGFAGSLIGSLFAGLGIGAGLNFLVPTLVILGLVAFAAYVSEGVCGDWGSLFLMKVKGAPEAAAALVYGGVAVSALVSRLGADALRARLGAFRLLLGCSMVSTTGIAIVAFSPVWPVTLAGFVLAGFGLGPVVPLLFSLSGRIPDVSSSAASSFVSVFGYGGGAPLLPAALRVARRALRHRRDL